MPIESPKRLTQLTRRVLLASLLLQMPALGEVTEVRTSSIDRRGVAIHLDDGPIRQVQDQGPVVPPAPNAPVQGPQGLLPAPAETAPSPPFGAVPEGLNVDPNADIQDLLPPAPPVPPPPVPPPPTSAPPALGGAALGGLGAASGGFSSAPNMIGDLFGGGVSTIVGTDVVPFSGYANGDVLTLPVVNGSPNARLVFEFGGDPVPDDVFTTGTGMDLAGGDGFADTFALAEPLPPSDAPTSTGPGFTFDGGTAVYVAGDGSATTPQPGAYTDNALWYLAYSYSQTLLPPDEGGRPIPTPGVSVRRVKLSENFSPEVRDRCFGSYNFFNDAYGGLGDVSRYTLGLERVLVDRLISLEARLLMAGTYGSTQALDNRESRDFELGNAAFIGKAVLLRNQHFIWSGGLGFTIPSADDTRVKRGGREILVIKNRTVHLLPFTALLLRLSEKTYFQAYMQLDVAANGDPIYGNLSGGSLSKFGVFNASTLVNLDFAVNHLLYRNRNRGFLRQVLANAELHYTGSLQESDVVTNEGLTYTNLQRYFNVLTATAGFHFVLGDNVVVTPAMSVPMREGLDEQYDYEAIVQVNYLH